MKRLLSLSPLLLLAAVLACAAADDLEALKATLLKLCGANTEGMFGSCCRAKNNGQDITAISSLSSCFGSTEMADSSTIKNLFATNGMLPSE